MRQSGRTSRIVDFAVDQLFSVGQVIVTDHVVFEYPESNTRQSVEFLTEKVRKRIEVSSYGTLGVNWKIEKFRGINVVHFKTYRNEQK
jgi:hypothetical protein